MSNLDPTIIRRATATPPAFAEGECGVLSTDLAGNLRVTGGSSSQTINGAIALSAGTQSIGSVVVLGTSAVSIVGTSNVSVIGTVPVTLSSTSLTGTSAVSVVGTSAVSHVGPQPVSLLAAVVATSAGTFTIGATNATASIGTVTIGAASNLNSLATIQLAGTNVTGSIGTVTLGAASNQNSLGTLQLAATVATASIGTVTIGASSNQNSLATFSTQGLVANDAPVSGNPVLIGGRAATTNPTAISTDGDLVYAQLDKYGRVVVAPAPQDLWGQGTVIIAASTATTSVIAAGGASIKWALSTVGVTSTQTATTTRVDIVDGLNNGGTLIHSFWFPAGISSQDGMSPFIRFNPPWVCSANTAIGAKCSASVTDVRVVATAYKVL